ncbi:AAA family ATPase [Dietzia lutea]|uniref:AAA family ATPase n=1 Tax=Dietzia lutea TaxID=546160 RepID=A0A2S1RC05_9ACTN|nr:AAA family ATPase [Dietzia lutea]
MVLTDEVDHALELLHGGHDLFLTGKAGTGKSTLIRRFLEETRRPTLVAAPTGIAALNVGGYTIHRLFGLHPGFTVDHVRSASYRPGRFAGALAGVRTLIVDEASMIRADLFDMMAIALERFGPDPTMPFGGVQLVLVGDLFQLPPVVTEAERPDFDAAYTTPYFFSAERFDRDRFPTVDLTHVFRQSGDPELTAILNSIREGTLVGTALERLNSRTDPGFEPPDDAPWLTLTTTNRMAAAHNRRRLDRLPGAELTMEAAITGDLTGFEPPTEARLVFKVGAQVMMLTNDPADRWVNGSIGRVLDASPGRREGRGETGPVVVVGFPGGEVAEVAPHTWDVTRPYGSDGTVRHEAVGSFSQFPFTLAWAITIHKSQGQTLDRLIVDLGGGTFAPGQLYVALSRSRSLDGLVLTRPVRPGDLGTDRRILRFLRDPEGDVHGRRYCAIAALTVGGDGARSRPRPVELAVVFPDGSAVTTLVNPQRDLGQARADYGISASDVLLAPTLPEAWAMIAPLVDGYTPIGVNLDATLECLAAELERLGSPVAMPPGVDIPSAALIPGERARHRAGSAIRRARVALEARERLWLDETGAGVFDVVGAGSHRVDPHGDEAGAGAVGPGAVGPAEPARGGYLLTRDGDAHPPSPAALPQLSAMLRISAEVSAVLLDPPRRGGHPGTGDDDEVITAGDRDVVVGARGLVADQIRRAAQRVPMTAVLLDRLRLASEVVGSDLTRGLEAAPAVDVAEVLRPGARVCFTGSALDRDGTVVARDEMEGMARRRGLEPVSAVTKSRCDVLVIAEPGSQSTKSRAAQRWGTPVVPVADFLRWAGR